MRLQWLPLLLCALLSACASAPPVAPPTQLLNDAAFNPPSERIRPEDVFAVNDAMRHYLRNDITSLMVQQGKKRGLIQALYQRDQLRLDYDAAMTRNAAQAFEARAGNCLSLVIMTAALAKEMGLQVRYHSAWAEEAWSRTGNTYFRSGHVNITLGSRSVDMGAAVPEMGSITVDFLPPQEGRSSMRTEIISEADVIAMYMNNRSAEALVQGKLDDAYWWAREAMMQSPGFLSAYNTLAVVYRRHGNLANAEQVFRHVLAHEPNNTRAMFNLAQLLDQTGRQGEARSLKIRLAQLEPTPPFYYLILGIAARQ
jgi:tetratricopeptide (TPR) repeat protein